MAESIARHHGHEAYSGGTKPGDIVSENAIVALVEKGYSPEGLIPKSIDLIKSTNKASTSFLQRNFQVGYNKAARVMEALEQRGVVSPPNHAGKRDILINQ